MDDRRRHGILDVNLLRRLFGVDMNFKKRKKEKDDDIHRLIAKMALIFIW